MLKISLKKAKTDRIDDKYIEGGHIANESSKLPGHEARMKAHEARIQKEYLCKNNRVKIVYPTCECGQCTASG